MEKYFDPLCMQNYSESESRIESLTLLIPEGNGLAIDDDMRYIQETVGPALRQGLAMMTMNQPADPMTYLANFLLHFQYNKQALQKREEEFAYFMRERELINNTDVSIYFKLGIPEIKGRTQNCTNVTF